MNKFIMYMVVTGTFCCLQAQECPEESARRTPVCVECGCPTPHRYAADGTGRMPARTAGLRVKFDRFLSQGNFSQLLQLLSSLTVGSASTEDFLNSQGRTGKTPLEYVTSLLAYKEAALLVRCHCDGGPLIRIVARLNSLQSAQQEREKVVEVLDIKL